MLLQQEFSLPDARFPTSKRDYDLVTPMMEEVRDIVCDEIERMSPGIAIFGPSRIGKTRTIKFLRSSIKKSYPSVYCAQAIMVTRGGKSDARFFKNLATDFRFDMAMDGDGDDLRSAIVRQLLLRCSETHDPRLLMILDEAQRIRPYEYSFLIDLTNHLENLGLSPTVVLVGQPELTDRRDELIKMGRRDAIGRFLESPLAFTGVSKESQLQSILGQLDDPSALQFPMHSNICITEAYLPDLYKKGFRIAGACSVLWAAIEESAMQLNVKPIAGMQSLTKTIERALMTIGITEDTKQAGRKEWWMNVLHDSGYLKHLVAIQNPSDMDD